MNANKIKQFQDAVDEAMLYILWLSDNSANDSGDVEGETVLKYGHILDAKNLFDTGLFHHDTDTILIAMENMINAICDFIEYALYLECFITEAQADALMDFVDKLQDGVIDIAADAEF